jgi:hypothetical protein
MWLYHVGFTPSTKLYYLRSVFFDGGGKEKLILDAFVIFLDDKPSDNMQRVSSDGYSMAALQQGNAILIFLTSFLIFLMTTTPSGNFYFPVACSSITLLFTSRSLSGAG